MTSEVCVCLGSKRWTEARSGRYIIYYSPFKTQYVMLTFQQYEIMAVERPGIYITGPHSLSLPFKIRLSVSLISFNYLLSGRFNTLKI